MGYMGADLGRDGDHFHGGLVVLCSLRAASFSCSSMPASLSSDASMWFFISQIQTVRSSVGWHRCSFFGFSKGGESGAGLLGTAWSERRGDKTKEDETADRGLWLRPRG